MQGLILQLFRFSFLILIWIFIYIIIKIISQDLFSSNSKKRKPTAKLNSAKKTKTNVPKFLYIVKGGNLTGSQINLGNQPILIGRGNDCTLVLSDDYISNHHARIIPRSNGWHIEDLGATNGTFLDKTRVTTATKIPLGAKIQLGQTVLELR